VARCVEHLLPTCILLCLQNHAWTRK
jgi:hypothetical protein